MQVRPGLKAHILVVDDDESMRFLMQAKLFQSGYNVTLAASGSHAEQIFKTGTQFDLVLCDLKMPSKGGVDVIQFMREQKLNVPMIIITGFPERDKIVSAARMGIHDVLVKPVRHAELIRMIESKLTHLDAEAKVAA